VRGTIALKEITRGYAQLNGRLNRYAIAQSALLSLSHRVTTISGIEKNATDIIKEITLEALYGITFSPEHILTEEAPATQDSLKKNREGSGGMEPQKKNINSSIPTSNFSLSSALRGQSEVQELLKKHRAKDGAGKKSAEPGEKGRLSKDKKGKHYLTEKTLPLTRAQMQKLMEKFIDFKRQGKGTRGKKAGLQKPDYSKLKTAIAHSEDMKAARINSKGYQLQGKAIGLLLKKLVTENLRRTDHNRSKKEKIKDKASVRRYMRGDTYKDISMRHTLKALVRQGKKLEDISSREFRSFEKRHLSNIDIVLCIDVSESMGQYSKLRYAKIAAAGIAKAAIESGERIGLVAFSNSATTITNVTTKEHEITNALVKMEPHQFTNVGDGIKLARELLLKDKASHKKQIIIISDGIPNIAQESESPPQNKRTSVLSDTVLLGSSLSSDADREWSTEYSSLSNEVALMFKELMGSRHATREARKAREKNIEISFLYIGSKEKRGELLAKKIVRIGRGKFYNIKRLPDLPLKALELI
jgi:Mg-chelatase subunit ChlD